MYTSVSDLGQNLFRQCFSHVQRQAIIWTNTGLWPTGSLGIHFIEICIKIQKIPFKKIHLKMSSAKWQPFCLVLNFCLNLIAFCSRRSKGLSGSHFTREVHSSGTLCAFQWWRHQMETFSALLALCAGKSPVPVNSPHKGQWHRALMFSLICAWINGWVNNREAGDLRGHRAHYDVIVIHSGNYAGRWLHSMSSRYGNAFHRTGHLCGKPTGH